MKLEQHRPPLERLSADEVAHVSLMAGRVKTEVTRALRVRKGKSRATYRLDTPHGRLALKHAHNVETLRREAQVIDALHTVGFRRIPRRVSAITETDGSFFVVYEWIDGFSAKPLEPIQSVDRHVARSIGRAVRELHVSLAAACAGALELPGAAAWAANLSDRLRAALALQDASAASFDVGLIADALDLVEAATLGETTPIHGDIRFANLVFDDRGEIRAFLDFEHAMSGTAKLESAVAIRNLFSVETRGRRDGSHLDLVNGAQYLLGYDAAIEQGVAESGWGELRSELAIAILDEIRFLVDAGQRLDPERLRVLMDSALSQLAWVARQ